MERNSSNNFLARDFIETEEGLIFAVVENGLEQGRVLSFLRYLKTSSGGQKLATQKANVYLKNNAPEYLYYSVEKDIHLHAVPVDKILTHYKPEKVLQNLLKISSGNDVIYDLQQLCQWYAQAGIDLKNVGITGSILIDAQKRSSDIDLVIYDRATFFKIRSLVKSAMSKGFLGPLSIGDWQASYQRRSCELSLSEYVWHEQRKFNKALINHRKFDLTLLDPLAYPINLRHTKLGPIKIQAIITSDEKAFDYPAVFEIDSQQAKKIVCYTATYIGQAFKGERVEVSGCLEKDENDYRKIMVGMTREAEGEYIKVIDDEII